MTGPDRMDDFKRIWQGQDTEDTKLTLEQVREKAGGFQSQKRVVGWVTLPFTTGITIFFSWLLLRAWMEHRPEVVMLIPIFVCLNFVYFSISLIRSPKVDPGTGFKTCLDVYRAHFEQERTLRRRVWLPIGLMLLAIAIGAVNVWRQSPIFPIRDAAQLGLGYILIVGLLYLGGRYKDRQIDRALHMVEGLERDIE